MLKVDIITGFLGAGKTTLINKLLAEAFADDKPVLIENEFGEVGIDDSLISDPAVQVKLLSSGCICCTLQGDFINGLIQVVEQYHPARVIVEPTGLAVPQDVLAACQAAAQSIDLVVNSCITVVDGENFLPLCFVTGDLYKKQIREASFVLLNRSNRLSAAEHEETLAELRGLNAQAVIADEDALGLDGLAILTWAETVGGPELAAITGEPDAGQPDMAAHSTEERDAEEHRADGPDTEGHHHHRPALGSDQTESLAILDPGPGDNAAIQELFEILSSDRWGKIYRAKGFLRHPEGGYQHLEYVYGGGEVYASAYRGPAKFIIIGDKLDEAAIQRWFAEFCKQ